ncbi:MAG TPA: DHH family phosphoesterase [Gemmataceae bacterium]|nr:DHH family phosphoesterase [Gemmataceae bacterium]
MPRNGADAETGGCSTLTTTSRRSDRFLRALEGYSQVTFVSHVQPDPDSLGSMLGLAHLVETCLGKPTRLTRDGLICRAENKAMVDLLQLDLIPLEEVRWQPDEAVVMVDSQPKTGRHSFNGNVSVTAVIDHHSTPGDLEGIPFTDIRKRIGATCSLVARYTMEQEISIPRRIATALLYGIESELSGFPREASPLDDSAQLFLYPLADKDVIAQIRNARLPESYYESILQALQNSFLYDRLMISWVNEMAMPEHAAEVCDFMMRFEQVDWCVVGGICQDALVLSVRTVLPQAEAGELLRQVVGKLGRAGGHDRRAGGLIRLSSTAPSAVEELQSELRRRFLKVLKMDETRGRRLMPLREMLQHLQ